MKLKYLNVLLLLAGTAQAEVPLKALPDGEVTRFGAWSAMLTGPTTRYRHGALGDVIEAGGFSAVHGGKTLRYELDQQHVFEDRRVRLVQLDGDAEPEAVIIRSHIKEGAAIAVYDLGTAITLKAESHNIGQANRWLNIVGVADFTGEGHPMIAAVITPHLTGSLRLYDLVGTVLEERTRIDGYTNHVNGTRELDLADVRDVDGDGLVDVTLPTIDHSATVSITFRGGKARLLQP